MDDVKTQIENIPIKLSKISFRFKLVERLKYLDEVSREDYPEQQLISPDSLNDFIIFLKDNPGVRYPAIVLTFSGNVDANWCPEHVRHCSVEFLGKGEVRYVIFSLDEREPDMINRICNKISIDKLMETIWYWGAHKWVLD